MTRHLRRDIYESCSWIFQFRVNVVSSLKSVQGKCLNTVGVLKAFEGLNISVQAKISAEATKVLKCLRLLIFFYVSRTLKLLQNVVDQLKVTLLK